MSLPSNLNFKNKTESSYAKAMRSNIQPQTGSSFGLGDVITINIPTRAGLCLVPSESYLKFGLTIKNGSGSANNYRWDSCGAHGIIQRLRIYHGSSLLEDIDQYGLLAKMLFDLQVPFDSSYGKSNILVGTRNDMTLTTPNVAAVGDISLKKISVFNTNSGASLNDDPATGVLTAIADAASTTKKTYCLNLISIVGSLCQNNYIPLFSAVSAPLRVELQLVDSLEKALCCTKKATQTLTIDNCEYVGNFVELSSEAVSMVSSSLQGSPLQFVVPSWKNFAYSFKLETSSTNVTMPINAKYSSLKSIFVTLRDNGLGAETYFPFSSNTKKISDYTFRVGSNVYPSKAPSTTTEMFCECLKAIGSLSDLNSHPAIDNYSYTLQDGAQNGDTVINVNSGSFYIGLDLESYPNSNKLQNFQGWNSLTDDIYCLMNFAGQGTATTCRFDAFACYDSVLVFDNNTIYAKF